jgi:pilus assembly protein CpaB
MRMKLLGGKSALVIAVVLGSLTSFLVWQYMQSAAPQKAAAVETTPVVVAATNIPARTVITPQMVRVQQLPVDGRHPNAFRSPGEVVGKVSRAALTPAEQVLSTKVYLQREESGLAFMVPEGMRAVSVEFSEVIGSGGMVLPGDHVDVVGVFKIEGPIPQQVLQGNANLALFQTNSQNSGGNGQQSGKEQESHIATVVLQDVEVLAVAQKIEGEETRENKNQGPLPQTEQKPAGSGTNPNQQVRSQPPAQPAAKTATFAVSPEDALRLILAEDRGTIRLALRRAKDNSAAQVPVVSFSGEVQQAQGS